MNKEKEIRKREDDTMRELKKASLRTQIAAVIVAVLALTFFTFPDYPFPSFFGLYILAVTVIVHNYHLSKKNIQLYLANIYLAREFRDLTDKSLKQETPLDSR